MVCIVAASGANAKMASKPLKILAFGDSVTAGYQLPPKDSYPKQLEKLLRDQGLVADVINAGVSGDTSSQALARTEWNLKQGPFDFVLLCIGANDGLRMTPIKTADGNIREMIKRFHKSGARVILIGMRLPTNIDPHYRNQFERMYREIAKDEKLTFLPFLLEGVATDQMLNLEDQIHPNAQGYSVVAQTLLKILMPLIPRT